MNPLNPIPPINTQWYPPLPPSLPLSSSFWNKGNVLDRLGELHSTLDLARAMKKELEMLIGMRDGRGTSDEVENGTNGNATFSFSKFLEDNRIDLASQESFSWEAANGIISKLSVELEPFKVVTEGTAPWEEKSAAVRLSDKLRKHERNKLWRKRKRKRVAEKLAKEREQFDQADQAADEWRAREIAKEIAKRKVEKMKDIAKLKAKEERKRLESELELVMIVEKLQELHSIRIQKLKKQGHFIPEEDDKFLERVRAAVEEEERQVKAAAETDAAKDAIATAEESRRLISSRVPNPEDIRDGYGKDRAQISETEPRKESKAVDAKESEKQISEVPSLNRGYDSSLANLPLEFYHYYHGSNSDMGTLIEVRRTWDAYIRPGGSRIPGHFVQPPPPADEIWASYLVKPR